MHYMVILTAPIPRTTTLGFRLEIIFIMNSISTKYGFQTSSCTKTKTVMTVSCSLIAAAFLCVHTYLNLHILLEKPSPPGSRCNPRPVATGRVSCVCDWLRDATGLNFGDRSWICNAALITPYTRVLTVTIELTDKCQKVNIFLRVVEQL